MKLAFLLWMASVLPQPAADQICLASTVYLEARSESPRGQMAVAEVAMRRRESGRWGDDVCSVVEAPGQFALSRTSKNYMFDTPQAWQEAWAIAGRANARGARVCGTCRLFGWTRARFDRAVSVLPGASASRGSHSGTVRRSTRAACEALKCGC